MNHTERTSAEAEIWTASGLAERIGGSVAGDGSRRIRGIAAIEHAGEEDLTFIASVRYGRFHQNTRAGVVIVPADFETTRRDLTYILARDPFTAFIDAVALLALPRAHQAPGIHPTAIVDPTAVIATDASVGAYAILGPDVVVGAGSVVGPHVVIGADSSVGEGCTIHAGVTIYHDCALGNRVIVHSGAVIGADGFGFQPLADGSWRKVPQIGRVEIGDDVEIGAGTTIDRATLGVTRVGDGVRLDNLIHVAHNVEIGENTVIAAQTGIAGSTRVGERNMIAGQVGFVGHIETVAGVIVEAGSGVSKSITVPGRYFGHPAREHSLALRQEGAARQLPDLLAEIRDLRRRLEELERAVAADSETS